MLATYEMVQAEEEQKVAQYGPFVQNREPNFDKNFIDPATHPGLVSSGFGTSGQRTSGFDTANLDKPEPEKPGFGGSVYGSFEGFGRFGTRPTGTKPSFDRQPFDFGDASTKPSGSMTSAPAPLGFGISPPAPAYTPYTPPALPKPRTVRTP